MWNQRIWWKCDIIRHWINVIEDIYMLRRVLWTCVSYANCIHNSTSRTFPTVYASSLLSYKLVLWHFDCQWIFYTLIHYISWQLTSTLPLKSHYKILREFSKTSFVANTRLTLKTPNNAKLHSWIQSDIEKWWKSSIKALIKVLRIGPIWKTWFSNLSLR